MNITNLVDEFGAVNKIKHDAEARYNEIKKELIDYMAQSEETELAGYNYKISLVEGKTTVWNSERIEELAKQSQINIQKLRQIKHYSYLKTNVI